MTNLEALLLGYVLGLITLGLMWFAVDYFNKKK